MLSYALAIAIALSSLVLFSTAFVMSDIHRQDDFLWSGVGLIYALVLWFCARNITGAVLLGQAAASVLLISYSWQTLKLRKAIANPEKAAEIDNFSILKAINNLWQRDRTPKVAQLAESEPLPKVTESEIAIPDTSTEQNVDGTPSTATKSKLGKKFWGKKQPEGVTKNNLNEILEEEVTPAPDSTNTPVTNKSEPEVTPTDLAVQPESESEATPQTTETQSEKSATTPEDTTEMADSISSESSATKSPQASSDGDREPESEAAATSPPKLVEESSTTPQIDTDLPETVGSEVDAQATEKQASTIPVTQSNSNASNSETNTNSEARKTENETAIIEPSESPSNLDNLETVEVAEVLEAMPEERTHQQHEDSSNIIEVNTTEIEPVPEDKNSSSPESPN